MAPSFLSVKTTNNKQRVMSCSFQGSRERQRNEGYKATKIPPKQMTTTNQPTRHTSTTAVSLAAMNTTPLAGDLDHASRSAAH